LNFWIKSIDFAAHRR